MTFHITLLSVEVNTLITFVTGISGSGRLEYLMRVKELAGGRLTIKDIGNLMFKKSRHLGIEIPDGKILDLDHFALNYLRAITFEELLSEVGEYRGYEEDDPDLIVSTHTCFRWKKHLLPGFNFYYLNSLNPDIYVTIIDNVHHVKARLESRPHWRGRLTLKDILIWRDEEIFVTKMLAEYQNKPFYIISSKEDPEVLYNIIYNVEKKKKRGEKSALKAYLSYPITYVRASEDRFKMKEEFKRKLKEAGVVIFDPMSIEEVDLVDMVEEAKKRGEEYVEVKYDGHAVKIPISEVEEAKDDILDQTVVRDYSLIDQADVVIVYYYATVMSPGVLSELNYGFTHNKEVYAVFPYEISPFFQYYTTKIFKDPEELLKFLKERSSG